MKRYTSGDVYRAFKKADNGTMLRKLNSRYFTKKMKIKYFVSQNVWFIDFNDFMEKINPRHIDKQSSLPRLRTKISAQNDWNAHHRTKIKHHIIDQICDAGKVFVYKNGRYNIINYDELEQELIKELKHKGKF